MSRESPYPDPFDLLFKYASSHWHSISSPSFWTSITPIVRYVAGDLPLPRPSPSLDLIYTFMFLLCQVLQLPLSSSSNPCESRGSHSTSVSRINIHQIHSSSRKKPKF